MTIGPRQTIAWSGSTRKPIDITSTPWLTSGAIVLPSFDSGLPLMPIIIGWLGP